MNPRPAHDGSPFDWRSIRLNEGILAEPVMDGQGMALWFPRERDAQFQHWERVGSVPHAEFNVEPGIGAVAAASVQAKQPILGFWGKLRQRLRKPAEGRAWVLPTGDMAEQSGDRRNDLLLVWAEDAAKTLDEAWIKSQWPASQETRPVGQNLFLVVGAAAPDVGSTAEQAQLCPSALAERLLASARQAGDRRREASALNDLALICLQEGKIPRAVALLEEALGVVRALGDRSAEIEVLGHAGLAMVRAGQPARALSLLEQRRIQTRTAGDQFGEKVALEHQGFAHAQLHDHVRSAACFEEALRLARAVGHRKHEADLLWYLAIQHAELGRREEAIAHGQAAIDLMATARNPQAAWFADHLRKYRAGETGSGLGANEPAGTEMSADLWGGSLTAGLWDPQPAEAKAAGSPGLLRMAVSAARSMAKFLGSGLKTAPPQTLQRRLRTCAACTHHTGLRCRLCGCFTNAKARMDHEECPIGKW